MVTQRNPMEDWLGRLEGETLNQRDARRRREFLLAQMRADAARGQLRPVEPTARSPFSEFLGEIGKRTPGMPPIGPPQPALGITARPSPTFERAPTFISEEEKALGRAALGQRLRQRAESRRQAALADRPLVDRPIIGPGQALVNIADPLLEQAQRSAGFAALGFEAGLPGQQMSEKLFAESRGMGQDVGERAFDAFVGADFPTRKISQAESAALALALRKPAARELFAGLGLGVKGALELAFDPINVAFGVGPVARPVVSGITSGVGALSRVAPAVARAAPAAARAARQGLATRVARAAPDLPTPGRLTPDEFQRQMLDLEEQHFKLTEEIASVREARWTVPIQRPPKNYPMGLGRFSDARLKALAEHERLNPYESDWFDSIDSVVVKEMKDFPISKLTGVRKIKDIQREVDDVLSQIKALEAGQKVPERRIGAVQPGFGEMAPPTQTKLLPEYGGEGELLPLADAGPLIGAQTRKEAIQRGQAEFPPTTAARGAPADIGAARTNRPFSGALFRGSGRQTLEEVYDPHYVQGPILGEATYATPIREFAQEFGPRVDEIQITLRNPLVISSDKEWSVITREAGLLSNVPIDPEEIVRLRQVIQAKGHDGVIIRVPESELVGKNLQRAFSQDTVVEFRPGPPTTTAAPGAPGGPLPAAPVTPDVPIPAGTRPGGVTPATRGGITGGLEVWVDPELRNLPFEEFMPGGSVYEQSTKLKNFNPLVRREIAAIKEWPSQSVDFVVAHEEAHGILGVEANRLSQGVKDYNEKIRGLLDRIKNIDTPGGKPRERDFGEAGQAIYEDAFVNFLTGNSVRPSMVPGRRPITDLTEAWADAYALHRTQPDLFRSAFPSEYKAFIKSLDELPSPNLREADLRMRFTQFGAKFPTREVLPGEQLPRYGTERPPTAPGAPGVRAVDERMTFGMGTPESRYQYALEAPSEHPRLDRFLDEGVVGISTESVDTADVIRLARGKPDAPITVYRAVPEGIPSIEAGDWIALNREYAEQHLRNPSDTIISKRVTANEIAWARTSDDEWLYAPKPTPTTAAPDPVQLAAVADEAGLPPREPPRGPGAGRRPPEWPPGPSEEEQWRLFDAETTGPLPGNIIGLRPLKAGLTKAAEIGNIARRMAGKAFPRLKTYTLMVMDEPNVSAALTERGRVKHVIDSMAQRLGLINEARVREVFTLDKTGLRVPALSGVDPTVSGAPTIADIAARLPRYMDRLTQAQRVAMKEIESGVGRYRELLEQIGEVIPSRPDVMEGGFYIPRGGTLRGGMVEPVKIPAPGSGTYGPPSYMRQTMFESQALGIDKGYEYKSLRDVLNLYGKQAGTRAVDRHVATFFRKITDAHGNFLGETQKMRLIRLNPEMAQHMEVLRRNSARLRPLLERVSERSNGIIDRFLYDPAFEDIDEFRRAIDRASVARGPNAGASAAEIGRLRNDVLKSIKAMSGKWKGALKKAELTPREQGTVGLPGLKGLTFPDEIANAANRVLRDEGPPSGKLAPLVRVVDALNNMYRFTRATLDNSAPFLQGSLALADDPKAWKEAMRVNILAWGKDGDRVLGRFILDFDNKAAMTGRPNSEELVRAGIRLGGAETEFALAGSYAEGVQKIWLVGGLVKRANRAFGYFGDSLRLKWVDDAIESEMNMGRSLKDIRASGDVEALAKSSNRMTGWTERRTLGNLGDLLFFAPRFLQSRLETVVKAGLGMRPGATMEQRMARNAILKMIAYGTALTVAVNEMLGEETDFRPTVNGRPNPNFMRIRAFDRDWSVFGTWNSLLRAMIMASQGDIQVFRGLGSGIVANAWDMLSGETFIGEPVRPGWNKKFVERMLENFTPFAMEEAPSALRRIAMGAATRDPVSIAGGLATLGGELMGGTSSPTSGGDIRDIEARKLGYGKFFTGIEPFLKDIVNESGPVKEYGDRRPSTNRLSQELDDIEKEFNDEMDLVTTAIPKGAIRGREAVQRYFTAQGRSSNRREQAFKDFDTEFKDPEDIEDADSRALAKYNMLFEKAKDVNGLFSPDELERLRAGFLSAHPGQRDFIIRNTNRRPVPDLIFNLGDFPRSTKLRINKSVVARKQFLSKLSGEPVKLGIIRGEVLPRLSEMTGIQRPEITRGAISTPVMPGAQGGVAQWGYPEAYYRQAPSKR